MVADKLKLDIQYFYGSLHRFLDELEKHRDEKRIGEMDDDKSGTAESYENLSMMIKRDEEAFMEQLLTSKLYMYVQVPSILLKDLTKVRQRAERILSTSSKSQSSFNQTIRCFWYNMRHCPASYLTKEHAVSLPSSNVILFQDQLNTYIAFAIRSVQYPVESS